MCRTWQSSTRTLFIEGGSKASIYTWGRGGRLRRWSSRWLGRWLSRWPSQGMGRQSNQSQPCSTISYQIHSIVKVSIRIGWGWESATRWLRMRRTLSETVPLKGQAAKFGVTFLVYISMLVIASSLFRSLQVYWEVILHCLEEISVCY